MSAVSVQPATPGRSLPHELFVQRLGPQAQAYFAALTLIAEIHARIDGPELGWKVRPASAAAKSIDIVVKELR